MARVVVGLAGLGERTGLRMGNADGERAQCNQGMRCWPCRWRRQGWWWRRRVGGAEVAAQEQGEEGQREIKLREHRIHCTFCVHDQ